MALNEMIAQGAQFKMPDPLEQYGRIAQIQQAQNQNALAQYQLGTAQRGDVQQNALYRRLQDPTFDQNNPENLTSLAQFGTPGIAAMKGLTEARNAALTGSKIQGDIREQQRKNVDRIMLDLSGDPSDEKINSVMQAIEADPAFPAAAKAIAKNGLSGMLGMSIDERKQSLSMIGMNATERTSAALAQQKLVAPESIQITRADGKIIFVDKNPYSATFKQEILPSQAEGMTPYQTGNLALGQERNRTAQGQLGVAQGRLAVEQNNANAPQYMVTDQGVVALPKRPKPGEITGALVMGPSGEPLQKELKPIPANINTAISTNNQTLKSIDEAIRLIKENPDAVGWKGYAPNKILNETNPEGVDARAAISNIGSLKLHERSGAAVTASEFPRLAPFIPLATDDAATVVKKLTQMRNIAQGEQQNLTETYTKEQGYRPSPLLKPKSAPAPAGSIHDQADAILRGSK